jgi:hypothetical protein
MSAAAAVCLPICNPVAKMAENARIIYIGSA